MDMGMATPERLELSTSSLEGWRSVQLSYGVFLNSSKNFDGGSSEVLLDGAKGKGNKPYPQRAAFCLETQHFPDSPNHPNFPSTLLKPNAGFHSQTVFRFSAK